MNTNVLDIISQDFAKNQRATVIHILSSIELHHTMDGDANLEKTRLSILKLANGNLDHIIDLTASAKIDFRDVIMWASQEKK
ncbi:hypothetical protein [Aquimarina algiphila]|uniref:hypothetical protein n=1 Tax=Aquimarina algiphila TaxID=2047982 RepID=UPI00232EC69A|nr:hypothetical protein [Aquimarina algiphila]